MPPSITFGNPSQQTEVISISCRFIATDQWLRAPIDPSWTIFELKRHLLARCVGGVPLAPVIGVPSGPRLLVPSPAGLITLAGLVRPPHAPAIKTGGRPSTAPHATGDDGSRRKPRLSLKVMPGLTTKPTPRTVTIHPPTPGIFGVPTAGATGPQPAPPIYFSPRNPLSSPELSPPHVAPISALEDESSPSSPNTQHDAISLSSRSTVALAFSQPHSHATSPTLSSRASPPSRPFSPTALPRPAESQSLFGSDHPILFTDIATTIPSTPSLRAQSTPPVVRAMSTPPSPYSPKVATPLTSRPQLPPQLPPSSPPTAAARSPPLPSSLASRYESSRFDASSQISRSDTNVDSIHESDTTHSPLLSAAEFLELESEPDVDGSYDLAMRSPSPSAPGAVSASSGSTVFANKSITGVYYDNDGRETGRTGSRDRRNWEDEFRLVSFAQGCVLDEHSTVADLRIRPGELLEIQRTNAIIHLARPTYTLPYFEAPVYVLKRTPTGHHSRPHTSHQQNHFPARPHQHHIQPTRDYSHYPPPRPLIPMTYHDPHPSDSNPPMSPVDVTPNAATRVRSRTVTARDVQDGLTDQWDDTDGDQEYAELELSGLEGIGDGPGGGNGARAPAWNDSPATTRTSESLAGGKIEWKLRWLTMREGKVTLSRYRGGQPQCERALATILSAQQLPAVPQLGSLPHHYISVHFTGASRKERERDREEGIGIRMMDGATHAHFLRVLLRIINTPGTHAFLPTDTPHFTSPPPASQYPEWRQYIVQRAWLTGRAASVMRGALAAGPWMRAPWTAWTDKEAELFSDEDASEYGDENDDGDLYESEIGGLEGFDHGPRDSDSEIEWDVEGWRAWESENAFGTYANNAWLKSRVDNIGAGRPRSRSLAAPSSRSSSIQTQHSPQQTGHPHQPMYPYPSQQPYAHHDTMLSPVSTSSDLSTTSPNRRARSSTIAVPSQPESPGSSSPTWSPTLGPGARRPLTAGTAGIETVLRTSTSNADTSGAAGSRRPSTQSRSTQNHRSETDRRGSATSLEMQRALPPNRRAVTSPAQGTKIP